MFKFKTAILAAALGASIPAVATAQEAPETPSQAELQSAAKLLDIFMSALQSEKVPGGVKNAIFSCLYQNNLKTLSIETSKVVSANAQLSEDNPGHVLSAAAQLCGYQPAAGAESEAPGR